MVTRKDCIDEIIERAGSKRSRKNVEAELADLDERAGEYEKRGYSRRDSYTKAAEEKARLAAERAALARKQERENAGKLIDLQRWSDERKAKDKVGERTALEARLVGVNNVFYKSQDSAAAKWKTYFDKWTGQAGLTGTLRRKGLDGLFASGKIEDDIGRELHQINKGERGQPGITKNPQALEIAKIKHAFDKRAIADHNRSGGWIRSYDGYVAKSSHDPDAIRYAAAGGRKRPLIGFDMNPLAKGGTEADRLAWFKDTIAELDLKRTFGSMPAQTIRDSLYEMWPSLASGDHFDYAAPTDDPVYLNVAGKAAAHRELHFKDYDSWKRYNAKYGLFASTTEAWMRGYDTLARQTALLETFGTRPKETLEQWVGWMKKNTKSADPEEFQRLEKFTGSGQELSGPLMNRFGQLDGSANRPVNRLASRIVANWMVWERVSMLGRVLFTHIAGLPTKSSELRYWGAGLADQYRGMFGHMVKGGADAEELNKLLWTGADAERSAIAARYDVADSPKGLMSRAEHTFFKFTGVTNVLENQRNGAEQMMARQMGLARGKAFVDIGDERQRMLRMFGMEEPEWKALHQVDWTEGRGGTYLTPSDALKLGDDHVKALLAERPPALRGAVGTTPEMIAKARQDLATSLATMYGERGRYAMFMPSVKGRAILYQGTQSGSVGNLALRLMYQFKQWPLEIALRTWGRMIYGEGGLSGTAISAAHFVVASAIFGTVAELLRDTSKGINGAGELAQDPFSYMMRGLLRSGAGTIAGDFIFGQYDRHGRSGVADLAGPTFSKLDQLLELIHAGEGEGEKHPWKRRGADAIGMIRENTPFVNLWATSWAFEHMVLHELQEAISPGYIRRSEETKKKQQGVRFLVSPQRVHQIGALPAVGEALHGG